MIHVKTLRVLIPWLVGLAIALPAQNPNGPLSTLTVNGSAGPPFPMQIALPSPGQLTISISGVPGLPWFLAHNPLAPGTLFIPGGGGIVDIALNPPPTILFDGFGVGPLAALYNTGATGTSTIVLPVPAGIAGPLGAIQAVVAAPTPVGISLTAAANLVVGGGGGGGGPIPLAQNGSGQVALGCPFTFYGNVYNSVWVNANGNLTFQAPDGSAAEASAAMLAGPPRIAPFWHALDPNLAVGGATPSVSFATNAQGTTFTWTDVVEFVAATLQPTTHRHSFSVALRCDGSIVFDYTSNRQKSNVALAGISPGNNLVATPSRNLSLVMPVAGAALEAIYETFPGMVAGGIPGRFDLQGRTLTLAPAGPAGNPTLAYNLASSVIAPRIDYIPPFAINGGIIQTLRGAGFAPGSTVQYRLTGGGGIYVPTPFNFQVSSEEIMFGMPAQTPGDVFYDIQVSSPGGNPPPWIGAMETYSAQGQSSSGTTGFGPLIGFQPDNAGINGFWNQNFVYYGVAYPPPFPYVTFLNANGCITFGAQSQIAAGSAAAMSAGIQRIAGLWCDLAIPAFQNTGTDTVVWWMQTGANAGTARYKSLWRCAPEWPDAGSNTFAITLRGPGFPSCIIETHYGPGVITAENAVCGITDGTGPGAVDLTANLNLYTAAAGVPIFEQFTQSGNPFDLQDRMIRYIPANPGVNTAYSIVSP